MWEVPRIVGAGELAERMGHGPWSAAGTRFSVGRCVGGRRESNRTRVGFGSVQSAKAPVQQLLYALV